MIPLPIFTECFVHFNVIALKGYGASVPVQETVTALTNTAHLGGFLINYRVFQRHLNPVIFFQAGQNLDCLTKT